MRRTRFPHWLKHLAHGTRRLDTAPRQRKPMSYVLRTALHVPDMAHKRSGALFEIKLRRQGANVEEGSSEEHGPRLQVWRPKVHMHDTVQVLNGRMPL
ncbi:hypothetical protein MTO96_031746 [Rhipicephalus appendiculatus]